jgi:hypothetical protein
MEQYQRHNQIITEVKKGKVVAVYATKAYSGSGGISRFFLDLGTRWMWVLNMTRPIYSLERTRVPIE